MKHQKNISKNKGKRQSLTEEGFGIMVHMKIPKRCDCGRELLPRGEFEAGYPSLVKHEDGIVDEFLECSNHHLYKVTYVPSNITKLVSEGMGR